MKYLITIGLAVALGLHWNTDMGWLIVGIATVFIIIFLKDRDYEREKKERD